MEAYETYEAYLTREMLQKPITTLSRLIANKWFLTLQTLSERTGVPVTVIENAVEGGKLRADNDRKLRRYLENYKGEGDSITKGEVFKGNAKDVFAELKADAERNKGMKAVDWLTKRKLEQAIAEQFGISVEEYRRIMGG